MFDSVCKFLAESFATDLARWVLGDAIAGGIPDDLISLSPSDLSLEPIRASHPE